MNLATRDVTPYLQRVGKLHNIDWDGVPNALRITWSFLTADLSVFYPFAYTHPISSTPHLTLQVGPLITVSLIVSLLYVRSDKNLRAFLVVAVTSTIIACSLFYVVPFWKYMPTPFAIIEFPYRLLMLSCVFGSILVGLVLDNAYKHRARFAYAALGIGALTQICTFRYAPKVAPISSSAAETSDFLMHDYWEAGGSKLESNLTVDSLAQTEPFTVHIEGPCARMIVVVRKGGVVSLPILYSRLLSVRVDDQPVESYNVAKQAAVKISEGTHHIQACRWEPIKYPVAIFAGAIVFMLTAIGMSLGGTLKPRRLLSIRD
jgi:hypothetical protein